ncbi:MAG: 23S rRNA (uracil(1939)-C(5))-methyltransferase RlmD [Bacteroidales bacterium]|nr:23S rRNA (uracil(1939)-C(5))-methyltransferase RlmD [Bacteroidales bacterium]
MGRKRKKLPLIENLEIIDIGSEGKSVARKDDMVVFVTRVIPGDIVDVQVTRKRKNYLEGFPVKFHKYSDDRETPFCEHFGVCGGCKWQNLPYEKQLFYKQKQVVDQLKRIGNLSGEELDSLNPILASPETTHYRNKLEFTFSDNKWITKEELDSGIEVTDRNGLGFHIPKMFDKILDISNCYLQPEPSNKIRAWFRKYTEEYKFPYFNLRNQVGLMRNLIVRTASTGEVMVIVAFYDDNKNLRENLLSAFQEEFPDLTSLYYVVNQKPNDTILDQDLILFHGKEFITENMEGLDFKLGPKSFYQTNSHQAYNLYKVTREYANLSGKEIVYDLYTGTGTIANFVASKSLKVIGIEVVPEAIEDAVENSKRNNIKNATFVSGDIKDVFNQEFMQENGTPDVVIMDPPRAGLHKNVIDSLIAVQPDKIVYVSCNPATQARDISLLKDLYLVKKIQPVDMFPNTHHVENVVLLEKK